MDIHGGLMPIAWYADEYGWSDSWPHEALLCEDSPVSVECTLHYEVARRTRDSFWWNELIVTTAVPFEPT